MGKMLDTWLQTELPKLQMLLAPAKPYGPPQPQPEGGTTFAAPPRPRIRGQELGPSGVPSGFSDQQSFAEGDFYPGLPRPPATPTFQGPPPGGAPTPGPTFAAPAPAQAVSEGPPMPDNAASTFEPEVKDNEDADVTSWEDVTKHHPAKTKKGAAFLERLLGGPQGLNAAYQQATGAPPPPGLTREEKGQLLMEFGLRLLAHNAEGQGDSFGAIGLAGAETLQSMRGLKQQKVENAQKAEEAKQLSDLREAQIAKARADKFQLKTDSQGRLVRINVSDGTSQVVLDNEGQPVFANEGSGREFESELTRKAFEGAFCEGLTGDALKNCQQRALAFSKGGATEFALPEQLRVRVAMQVRQDYADPDNRSARRRLPDGSEVQWSRMTNDQQEEAMDFAVDRFMKRYGSQVESNLSAKPAPTNNWGLTDQQLAGIGEGKRVTLTNGVVLVRRNGKVIQIDPKTGNPIQ